MCGSVGALADVLVGGRLVADDNQVSGLGSGFSGALLRCRREEYSKHFRTAVLSVRRDAVVYSVDVLVCTIRPQEVTLLL